jgi:1-acyl-sn-glycerol-3-phosphate acyltransferase
MSPKRRFLPRPLRIATAAVAVTVNSIVHITPLMIVALLKVIFRWRRVRAVCDRTLMAIAASWIDVNSALFEWLTDTRVVVTGLPEPMPEGHFLVICNHQSWVDIPVLQKLFNRRLPLLRFFLKSQLFWVPILGLAWWALDFPFMKRYTRAQIERKPRLAGRDIEVTRKACAKFRHIPVSVVNFVEGTRYSSTKHAEQDSPFAHLLKPRAGGTAFVLDAMGETLDTLVDVTIVYPHGAGELGELFGNRIPEIRVHVELSTIPDRFRNGDYQQDADYRAEFQDWINTLWQAKDRRIDAMLNAADPTSNDPQGHSHATGD